MRILTEVEMSNVAGGIFRPGPHPGPGFPPQYQQDKEEKSQTEQNSDTEKHIDNLLRDASRTASDTCGDGQVDSVEVSSDGNGGGSASYSCKPLQ